ncbi:unnamed protein product [Lactuca saligna]|uniref:Uncharacterized protein n=1 Tax=Lactuca saligna TaxID=75948 RepID=A0AA35YX11_LACSI|nr:unnamed protein product [Lactuca saligna]
MMNPSRPVCSGDTTIIRSNDKIQTPLKHENFEGWKEESDGVWGILEVKEADGKKTLTYRHLFTISRKNNSGFVLGQGFIGSLESLHICDNVVMDGNIVRLGLWDIAGIFLESNL